MLYRNITQGIFAPGAKLTLRSLQKAERKSPGTGPGLDRVQISKG